MPSRLKLSVGYQLPDLRRISEIVAEFAADIEELYFPWLGAADGRGASIGSEEEQRTMEEELADVRALGVRLNMLWNANCYGGKAISSELERQVTEALGRMREKIGLDAITTTSPFIASCAKESFPQLEVRASVNMGIGSVSAMKCVQRLFDSFYLKRELNRFPERIKPLRDWCGANGKKLYLLANSGCLSECPLRNFHDNLVAHEREAAKEESPWGGFQGACWDYHAKGSNRHSILADSTWLRPEEIDSCSELIDGVKLATRTQRSPERVVASYARRSFSGNILSLMEPDFSCVRHLENSKFPDSWLKRFGKLGGSKLEDYCKEILEDVER